MSWFIYEVPEYNEDGTRIEPFSDLRSRVLKVSGQAMADELESVRENAATTADTPTRPLRAARCGKSSRIPDPLCRLHDPGRVHLRTETRVPTSGGVTRGNALAERRVKTGRSTQPQTWEANYTAGDVMSRSRFHALWTPDSSSSILPPLGAADR